VAIRKLVVIQLISWGLEIPNIGMKSWVVKAVLVEGLPKDEVTLCKHSGTRK